MMRRETFIDRDEKGQASNWKLKAFQIAGPLQQ
jgi:hypothetical protein